MWVELFSRPWHGEASTCARTSPPSLRSRAILSCPSLSWQPPPLMIYCQSSLWAQAFPRRSEIIGKDWKNKHLTKAVSEIQIFYVFTTCPVADRNFPLLLWMFSSYRMRSSLKQGTVRRSVLAQYHFCQHRAY